MHCPPNYTFPESVIVLLCVAGGLDEALYNVIAMARDQEIPFVFALGRKALGRCVNKLVPVSVVGIFNYSGAEVRLCLLQVNMITE